MPIQPTGTRRLKRALEAKPNLGQVLVAVLVGLMGFGGAIQMQLDDDDLLTRARRTDLVQILNGLNQRNDRLENQIRELEANRRDLLSSTDRERTALEQNINRMRQLSVIAGTAPAHGPGIVVTITDASGNVPASTLLSAVMELRDAGAEAIQVGGAGGAAVRVVATTYFLDLADGVEVSGVTLTQPYRFVAIGAPDVLAAAMQFPQGVVEQVESEGGNALITQLDEVTVDVLHEASPPQYARPAPEDEK